MAGCRSALSTDGRRPVDRALLRAAIHGPPRVEQKSTREGAPGARALAREAIGNPPCEGAPRDWQRTGRGGHGAQRVYVRRTGRERGRPGARAENATSIRCF